MEGIVNTILRMDWTTYATSPHVEAAITLAIQLVGGFLLLAVLAAFLVTKQRRWAQAVLILASALLSILAWAVFHDRMLRIGEILEQAISVTVPLCLVALARRTVAAPNPEEPHADVRGAIGPARIVLLMKCVIAATFAGHGLYAVGLYPVPGEWVTMVMAILRLSEPGAFTFLWIAGVLDFAVAVLVFVPGRTARIALLYAAFWGAATALARSLAFVGIENFAESARYWFPETFVRLPHAGVPLALYFLTRPSSTRVKAAPRALPEPFAATTSPGESQTMQTRKCIAAIAAALTLLGLPSTQAATDYFRLSWRDNPATTMVVGWRQNGGSNPVVHYGPTDYGTNYASYPYSATPARTTTAKGMTHSFARLTGLNPDTAYYFVVRDSSGTSARMWFRTAPAVESGFTFIVGGDSRNNRTPRQQANQMVSKLRPLFILFGGDYTDKNTDSEWSDWFADWQLTRSTDGRMYPIVAARGNHDDNTSLVDMFDIPSSNVYFALGIGGGFMRLYTLNSEITPGGTQQSWLSSDLSANSAVKWKIAHYHKPMFPHQSGKSENTSLYSAWAQLFYDYAMSLVVECDSHCVKTTWPVKPTGSTSSSSAFTRDDATGTVYVGEGCWGAPLRTANDNKSYTRNSGSFNMIQWVHAHSDRMELRTVTLDNVSNVGSVSDSSPFTSPANLNVWNPSNGSVLTMYPRGSTPSNAAPTVSLTSPADGSSYTAPATISLAANAADSDGTVTQVEFLANGSVIATDTSSPYSFSWSSVAAGTYTLAARATDNDGATTTSSAISVTVSSSSTGSTTVSFQSGANGYTGATDTKIRSTNTNTNYGSSTNLEVDGSPDYATLLKWNLSSIPAGKIVTAVSITVNITNVSSQLYEIYALRRAWSESSATWNQASSGVNWGTAGANSTTSDRESTVLGAMSSSSTGLRTFSLNSSGIAKVQSWIDNPSSNHGFVIMDYVNNSDGLDFSSRETSTVSNRPKITITYE